MTLKLDDIIYSAWVIIASKEELERIITNFRDAVLAFQGEEVNGINREKITE